jgi:hypothetical protein
MCKVTINFKGSEYQVRGRYYAGFRGTQFQPSEPPKFEVEHVLSDDGGNVLFATDPENIAEFELECLKQHQEDLAWAEIENADRRIQQMKEADHGFDAAAA